MPQHISKLLVANRGEIALRVVRTTAEAGVVRLVAGDKKNFDELTISTSEIEQLYQVSAKLTIN